MSSERQPGDEHVEKRKRNKGGLGTSPSFPEIVAKARMLCLLDQLISWVGFSCFKGLQARVCKHSRDLSRDHCKLCRHEVNVGVAVSQRLLQSRSELVVA